MKAAVYAPFPFLLTYTLYAVSFTYDRQTAQKAAGNQWLAAGPDFRQPPYHDQRGSPLHSNPYPRLRRSPKRTHKRDPEAGRY